MHWKTVSPMNFDLVAIRTTKSINQTLTSNKYSFHFIPDISKVALKVIAKIATNKSANANETRK